MSWATAVRLVDVDGSTVLVEVNDIANGLELFDVIVMPDLAPRQARIKSARVAGSFGVGASVDDDGTLVLSVRCKGDTWGESTQVFLDLLAGLRSADEFYVETELEGVATRWFCDAPVQIRPMPIDRIARSQHHQEYELRFTVQPSPVVTIGA